LIQSLWCSWQSFIWALRLKCSWVFFLLVSFKYPLNNTSQCCSMIYSLHLCLNVFHQIIYVFINNDAKVGT
jgi:hypothetical protein